MTDHLWVELRELIDAAWEDRHVLTDPPRNEAEWGFLGDSVTDAVYAFVKANREG